MKQLTQVTHQFQILILETRVIMTMMKIMNKNGKDISFPFSSFMRRKKIKNNIYQEIEIARNQKDWVKLEILSKRYLNI